MAEDDPKKGAAAVVEDPETPPAEPPAEPTEPTEPEAPPAAPEEPEAPAEPSAEELKQQLVEKDAEIAQLKAEQEEEPEPSPTDGQPTAPQPALPVFVNRVVPQAKKDFIAHAKSAISVKDDGTLVVDEAKLGEQFETLLGMTDSFMTSVFHDKQDPLNREFGRSVIEASNKIELVELYFTPDGKVNAKALQLTPKILSELKKVPWATRANPGQVRKIYQRLAGASAPVTPAPVKPAAPVATKVIKDAAAGAGGGTGRRPVTTVTLTAEQESERVDMENEAGVPVTPQQYKAKLDARNDIRKQKGMATLKTLKSTA